MRRQQPLRRRLLAGAVAVGVAGVATVVFAPAAAAHPLGNFTTNTALALRAEPDRVVIDYAVDAAEIPTVRAAGDIDADRDGTSDPDELADYAATTCASIAEGTDLRIDGDRADLDVGRSRAALVAGAAGLDTLRIDCALSAPADLDSGDHGVTVTNGWVGDRIGWHEITAVGDGTTLSASDVPTTSSSESLLSYPDDALATPPDVRSAEFRTSPGGAAAGAARVERAQPGSISAIPGVDSAGASFTDLVSREQLTLGVALVGLVLAILLGSLHALAPGHGKTVMAAYLLGGEGTGRQAFALCATVTITHTAGVLVLGTVLTVSTVVAPERLYPVLGAISGLIVASIGVTMLRRARGFRRDGLPGLGGHTHPHAPAPVPAAPVRTATAAPRARRPERTLVAIGHGNVGSALATRPRSPLMRQGAPAPSPAAREPEIHGHSHDDGHSHDHGHTHGSHSHGAHSHVHPDPTQPMTWRSLVGMGFAGGMVPSPSALLVLLGAIALGRTWFGVALVIAYGVGMAMSLVAAGLLLLRIRNRLDRYLTTRRGRSIAERLVVLPSLTASFVVIGGVYIAVRALLQY